jgi:hypothetical protein
VTITDAACNPGDRAVAYMDGCIVDKGTYLASPADGSLAGVRVEAGGSVRAGSIYLRQGAVIRALPEGGFVIEAELEPVAVSQRG